MLHLLRHLRSHYAVNQFVFPVSVARHSFCSDIPSSDSDSEVANTNISSQSAAKFSQSGASGPPSVDSGVVIAENVRGIVRWFNPRKNSGFIRLNGRDEEVFVHVSDIAKKNPLHNERSLLPGEEVEFTLLEVDNNRRKAVNVTGPGGAAVRGIYSPSSWTPAGVRLGPQQPRFQGNIVARNVQGTVQSFHVVNGWGFIKRADTGEDIFVTYRGIMGKNPQHLVKSLAAGELVQFHIVKDARGKQQAIAVTGPNGVPVQGNYGADGPLALRIKRGDFRRDTRTSNVVKSAVSPGFAKI